MKRLFVLLFVTLFISCKKDAPDPDVPEGGLYQITVNGKVYNSFEYENGLLVKQKQFGPCDTPYGIINYGYKSGKIQIEDRQMKALYSSSSTSMCDPAGAYEQSLNKIEYDAQGRISKILLAKTSVEFEYKNGEVIKRYFQDGVATSRIHYQKYDNKGNLIEEITPDLVNGGLVRYEYDDRPNPLYLNKGMYAGSAFEGPNNPVKAFGAQNQLLWERKFTYTDKGLPARCLESNGIAYVYHYQYK
jgi:hypothetical protein